jgi:uncharacterized protein YciI
LIIVTLTYKKELSFVDHYLEDHIKFLDEYYKKNKFLVSGRRANRVGGVIVVINSSLQEAQSIMKQDPFYKNKIADYEYTEFSPSKFQNNIKEYCEYN